MQPDSRAWCSASKARFGIGSVVGRWTVALAVLALATLARGLLDPALGNHLPYVTYFIAVAVIAWLTTTRVAAVSLFFGWLITDYLFVPPRHQFVFASHDPMYIVGTFTYFVVAGTSIAIAHAMRRAQRESRDSEQRYRTVVENQSEMVCRFRVEGTILFANDAYARSVGVTTGSELEGRSFWEFITPEDRGEVRRMLATLTRENPVAQIENRFESATGSCWTLWINRALIFDDAGRAVEAQSAGIDITDRKRAEEGLRRNRDSFYALVKGSPFGVYLVDADFRIAEHSAGAQKVFGGPVVGREFGEIMRTLWPEPFASEAIGIFRHTLETGEPYLSHNFAEVRADRGKKEAYDWRTERVTMPDGRFGVVCHFYDLTAERDLAAALRESENQFRAVFEQTTGGIAQTDLTGQFILVNHRFCEIVGRSDEEIYRLRMQDITHPEDLPANLEKVLAMLQGELDNFVIEKRYMRPDGSHVWVRNSVSAVREDDGTPVSLVAAVMDVTAEKEAAHALREADRRKDEFLATLAHELRNPLSPIRNSLHILRLSGSDDDEHARVVGMMERQVNHMVRLVDDLLEVSRITRGKIELRRETVELAAVVRNAVETASPQIQSAGHELTVSLPSDPVLVSADPVRLAQVLANLLSNAAKYTDSGGRIELAAHCEHDSLVITVRDNGMGIPADMLPKVFDLFTQVDRTLGRAQGGLGIGLALVRSLVRMHDGTVEAYSAGPGQGSEFTVRLPVTIDETSVQTLHHDAETTGKPLSGRRILIVDDNRDAANSLAMLLGYAGADVRTAYDGPSALEAICTERPPVVFVDIGMPGMDGYAVAAQVRSEPKLRDVKLIALTGWGQEEDRRRTKAAGFDHHLTKPPEIVAVTQLLEKISG